MGSLGASGDLAPLAHLSLGLIGEGYVDFKGERQRTKDVLHGLSIAPIELSSKEIADAISAEVPTARAKNTQFHIFRPGISGEEHYAMEIGEINRDQPILVRIHSACFTGDVLGSLKCDCGPQLHAATEMINEQGGGLLI